MTKKESQDLERSICPHPAFHSVHSETIRGFVHRTRTCTKCFVSKKIVEVPLDEFIVYETMVDKIDEFSAKFGDTSLLVLMDESD